MANPVPAFRGTECDDCTKDMEEGEDLYMTDNGRLCEKCAEENGYICECGGFKKAQYKLCWECNQA